jgi:hypothetical protein
MISTAPLFLSVNLVYIRFFYYKVFSVNVNFLFLAEDEEIGHNRIIKIEKVRSGFLGTTFDALLLLLPQPILSLDQNNSGENSLYCVKWVVLNFTGFYLQTLNWQCHFSDLSIIHAWTSNGILLLAFLLSIR